MGLIKAATSMVGCGLADQWLEVIEPDNMSDTTVMTKGVKVSKDDKRGSNRKGTEDVLTDGTVVHVYANMMMLLVDGRKIIDYTAEEGYYTIKNDAAPSMFNGPLNEALAATFDRFKCGGVTPQTQQVFYINLQEIKGIKFGTSAPLNYCDNFYNAELFLRAHGTYSIHVVDPILFYTNAIPKNKTQVEINDINEQYLAEFLTALQSAINQMSADGQRISYVPSKEEEFFMGLIKAATSMVGGGLADQWLEVIEPDNMSDTTVMTKGVKVRKDDKRGSNRKGTEDVLTDGTVVHVYPNMMMLFQS